MSGDDRIGNFLLASVLITVGIAIGLEMQRWLKVVPMAVEIHELQQELIQRGVMQHNPQTGDLEFVERKGSE